MGSITKQCPACGQNLRAGQHDWHLVCPSCSYEGSSLQVDIDVVGDHEVLNEALRQEGLSDLRQANFRLLSKKIAASVSVLPGERKPRLLCSWMVHPGHGEGILKPRHRARRPHCRRCGLKRPQGQEGFLSGCPRSGRTLRCHQFQRCHGAYPRRQRCFQCLCKALDPRWACRY